MSWNARMANCRSSMKRRNNKGSHTVPTDPVCIPDLGRTTATYLWLLALLVKYDDALHGAEDGEVPTQHAVVARVPLRTTAFKLR